MRPYFEAQAALVARLLGEEDRLAHALLLAGAPGVGKGRTGLALAQGLLCETPLAKRTGGMACGDCPGCHWFEAGNHPDFRPVALLVKDGKLAWEISIDQVREILEVRRSALEELTRRLMDVESIDSDVLMEIIDATSPGPVIVPGTNEIRRKPNVPELDDQDEPGLAEGN